MRLDDTILCRRRCDDLLQDEHILTVFLQPHRVRFDILQRKVENIVKICRVGRTKSQLSNGGKIVLLLQKLTEL